MSTRRHGSLGTISVIVYYTMHFYGYNCTNVIWLLSKIWENIGVVDCSNLNSLSFPKSMPFDIWPYLTPPPTQEIGFVSLLLPFFMAMWLALINRKGRKYHYASFLRGLDTPATSIVCYQCSLQPNCPAWDAVSSCSRTWPTLGVNIATPLPSHSDFQSQALFWIKTRENGPIAIGNKPIHRLAYAFPPAFFFFVPG